MIAQALGRRNNWFSVQEQTNIDALVVGGGDKTQSTAKTTAKVLLSNLPCLPYAAGIPYNTLLVTPKEIKWSRKKRKIGVMIRKQCYSQYSQSQSPSPKVQMHHSVDCISVIFRGIRFAVRKHKTWRYGRLRSLLGFSLSYTHTSAHAHTRAAITTRPQR